MEIQSKKQILERQQKIEQELLELLRDNKSNFTLDDIKAIIYNEEDQDDVTKIIAIFDHGQGLGQMNEILETTNDA